MGKPVSSAAYVEDVDSVRVFIGDMYKKRLIGRTLGFGCYHRWFDQGTVVCDLCLEVER